MIGYETMRKTVAGGMILLGIAMPGCFAQGYTGKCAEAIEPVKQDLTEVVSQLRTMVDAYHAEGKVKGILRARDAALEQAGCKLGCEEWRFSQNYVTGKGYVMNEDTYHCTDGSQ